MASPKVIAAAQAAASWARARRATWTEAPLPRPALPRQEAKPPAAPTPQIVHAEDVGPPARSLEEAAEAASIPTPIVAVPSARRSGSRWILFGVIGAGALGALAVGMVSALRTSSSRSDAAAARSAPAPAARPAPARTAGSLKVTSTPDGARVVIDGRDRGVTPLSIDDLPFGAHTVSIEGKSGSVQRSVMVTAENPTALLDEQIFDGWVAIFSPVEIVISEGNRILRPDDRSEIMLPPGRHQLRFVNKALAYDEIQAVVVKPGERTAYTVTPPKSTVSVTASDVADVFLDGTKIGTTPLNGVATAIGTHNLLVKRVAGGAEKRMPITVTVKPFSVAVTF